MTQWTVGERSGEVKKVSGKPKLPHLPAFKISDKTPETQIAGATNFNKMRQRLLEVGEMEEK